MIFYLFAGKTQDGPLQYHGYWFGISARGKPGLSTAEVERMMAAMDQVWRGQLDALAHALDEALRAKAVPAPAPARLKKFNVTYDAMGRVDVVVPTYEK